MLYFFLFSCWWFSKSGCFLAKNHLHPQGNHPSKFLLIRIICFGGVKKQTNTQTHWHPIALEEGLSIDWTYQLAMHGIYKREVLPLLLSFSFIFFCIERWYTFFLLKTSDFYVIYWHNRKILLFLVYAEIVLRSPNMKLSTAHYK